MPGGYALTSDGWNQHRLRRKVDKEGRVGQQQCQSEYSQRLRTGHGSDESVAKENAATIAKEYKAVLAQLKGKATISPTLK